MNVSDHDKHYCETENTPLAQALASFFFVWLRISFQFLGLESLGFIKSTIYSLWHFMNLQKVVLKLHLANANNKLLGNWQFLTWRCQILTKRHKSHKMDKRTFIGQFLVRMSHFRLLRACLQTARWHCQLISPTSLFDVCYANYWKTAGILTY